MNELPHLAAVAIRVLHLAMPQVVSHGSAPKFGTIVGVLIVISSVARADFGDVLLELARRGPEVAISEQFVLVGSPFRRTVYAYDVETGEHLADLKVNDHRGRIGEFIAIDGATALVSGNDVEAAFIFDIPSGQLLHTLTPEDPRQDQQFGRALAVSEGIALVGAPGDNELQDRGGAVYVFDVATGAQQHKLVPDAEFPRSGLIPLFGGSLAVEGGIAVIGESNSRILEGNFAVGGAYIFDVVSGQQIGELQNPNTPSTHDLFASSIDIHEGRVVIGVSGDDGACPGLRGMCWSGSAMIFDLESGEVQRKLTIADMRRYDHFGADSVLDGDVAIVTGYNEAENAYLFDVSTGKEVLRIPNGDVFAASHGKAAVVGRFHTQIIDIRDVPEPASQLMLCFAWLFVYAVIGRRS